MATYDNKHWLLSHIRNSFISTDDTGMCEIVMLGEDFPKLLWAGGGRRAGGDAPAEEGPASESRAADLDCYPEMDESDEDDIDPLAESYDLQHDMDFGIHRQRSNTDQRLEKMKQAQRKAAKIKMVKWENPPTQLTDQERSELFQQREVPLRQPAPDGAPIRSRLTDQLEKCPFLPQSRYLDYAKFDGTAQLGLPTSRYRIFMTMAPEDLRNYPIEVCVVATAKIQDLIGFVCYEYSIKHPEVVLGAASSYGLYICEEDGEVDWDFPCLDGREPCSKFCLTCLGMVDLKTTASKSADVHTSSIPEKGGFNAIVIPEDNRSTNQSMRSRSATFDSKDKSAAPTVPPAIKGAGGKARGVQRTGSSVTFGDDATKTKRVIVDNLKKKNNQSPVTGTSAPAAATAEQSSRAPPSTPQEAEALNRMKVHELVIEAPQYMSYRVQVTNRVRSNTHVLLGISGEKIEIDPLHGGSLKFWSRMKPVSYSIDAVMRCEFIDTKPNRTSFRLVYSISQGYDQQTQEPSPSMGFQHQSRQKIKEINYKHHDFVSDYSTAREIVEKVNRILELQPNPCRKEYNAVRDRYSALASKESNTDSSRNYPK